MKDIKQEIIDEIESSRDEQIKFLRRLVQTKSANPFVADPLQSNPYEPVECDVAELIFDKLKGFGLKPKYEGIAPTRSNVVCEIGKGKKTLIFNGHMDTVVPPDGYKADPYSGLIEDGKLYGVGAWDMKSSICSFIYAAKILSRFKRYLKGKLCLQFVVDEEPIADSPYGTRYLLDKGYVGDAAIVGEPGAQKLSIGNRGGYRFKIEVFGKAAHPGLRRYDQGKERGINAISEMKKVMEVLDDLKFSIKEHKVFPGRKNIFTFPMVIKGGRSVNIVPDYCVAYGSARILPGVTKEYLEGEITIKLDKLDVKYKLTSIVYIPSVYIEPAEKIAQVVKNSAQEILDKELILEGSGPWCDMWMFIEKGIPAVNFGPDGNNAHAANEWTDIQSVIDVTKIYALAALDFLSK